MNVTDIIEDMEFDASITHVEILYNFQSPESTRNKVISGSHENAVKFPDTLKNVLKRPEIRSFQGFQKSACRISLQN